MKRIERKATLIKIFVHVMAVLIHSKINLQSEKISRKAKYYCSYLKNGIYKHENFGKLKR